MTLTNYSITTNIESWFIPFGILMILCTILAVILAAIALIIIISNKTSHTIVMMLIVNSCLAELIFGSDMLGMAVFTFLNDLKQIQYQDSLCVFRGFMGYVGAFLQNYSYLLQAIYRYIIVVYPTRLFYQSMRFQAFLICLTWIFGLIYPIPYLLTNEIIYNVDNQICQMPLRRSFLTIYNALCIYMIPISLIVLVYLKLIRYVRQMNENITSANTLLRAQRELKMVRRIVILVVGVATIGFPYAMFIFISLFTTPPKYHFRVAYIFVDVSLAFVMIILFCFTDPLKMSVMNRIKIRRHVLLPTTT